MQKQGQSQQDSEFCELGLEFSQGLNCVPAHTIQQVEHFCKPDKHGKSWRCNIRDADNAMCKYNDYDKATYQCIQPIHPVRT
jgi:hypothetical protein